MWVKNKVLNVTGWCFFPAGYSLCVNDGEETVDVVSDVFIGQLFKKAIEPRFGH